MVDVKTPLQGAGHPDGIDERAKIAIRRQFGVVVGGAYELCDGRKFWMDQQSALEIVRRIEEAGLMFGEDMDKGDQR